MLWRIITALNYCWDLQPWITCRERVSHGNRTANILSRGHRKFSVFLTHSLRTDGAGRERCSAFFKIFFALSRSPRLGLIQVSSCLVYPNSCSLFKRLKCLPLWCGGSAEPSEEFPEASPVVPSRLLSNHLPHLQHQGGCKKPRPAEVTLQNGEKMVKILLMLTF